MGNSRNFWMCLNKARHERQKVLTQRKTIVLKRLRRLVEKFAADEVTADFAGTGTDLV